MDLRPAADAEPARWLFETRVPWMDLVRYGPPGFEVYVRIALAYEPDDDDTVGLALATLVGHTTTPDIAYAAIWEGWTMGPVPAAPHVRIPNRTMLLFTGPVAVLRDAPTVMWFGSSDRRQEPHLTWPEDRSWCLACEVDEEIEFTVGCSEVAAQALTAAMPGVVRRVGYGEKAPLYRD